MGKALDKKCFFTYTGALYNAVSEEENSNGTAVEFCINITLLVFCFVRKVSSREEKTKKGFSLSYLLVVRKRSEPQPQLLAVWPGVLMLQAALWSQIKIKLVTELVQTSKTIQPEQQRPQHDLIYSVCLCF